MSAWRLEVDRLLGFPRNSLAASENRPLRVEDFERVNHKLLGEKCASEPSHIPRKFPQLFSQHLHDFS